MLWFSWKASGVFLSPLHTHQLHFSLCEAEYEARQQQCYGQSIGQGQAHQTWVEQHDYSTPGNKYLSHQIQPFLTWIDRTVLVLNDSYHPKTCHYSDTNQLQADVQPLHGSTAKKQASLVLLQTPGTLPFKPEAKKSNSLISFVYGGDPLRLCLNHSYTIKHEYKGFTVL